MLIDNIEDLRTWLTTSIGPMCEADPIALAKYVIALVRKDRSEKDLKQICTQQLEVFFHKDTKAFVEKLFETIRSKSYISSSSVITQDPVIAKVDTSPKHFSNANSSNFTAQHHPYKQERKVTPEKEINDVKVKKSTIKSHSRSRSRSPVRKRSHSREDEERRARRHSGDDKRRRHTVLRISRHDTKFRDRRHNAEQNIEREKARDRDRDFRPNRARSRSQSWNRSRSRSWSSRSPSWSREHSPERIRGENGQKILSPKSELADKDYRTIHPSTDGKEKPPLPLNNEKYSIIRNNAYKITERCRDFDERGYCMRGDLCPYDHGADPVVVENVFQVGGTNSQSSSQPAVSLHHAIPPIINQAPVIPPPPPPPLPPPENYVPEPYNPEAPGMERTQRISSGQSAFWPPPPPPPPQNVIPPPALHGAPPPPSIHAVPPLYLPPMPHRTRELIGVPTIDDAYSHPPPVSALKPPGEEIVGRPTNSFKKQAHLKVVPSVNKPFMSSQVVEGNQFRRRPYENKRPFGGKRTSPDRCTLELRKVPRDLNNITSLNSYFSKFGNIVNIKVCLDDDPEAALIEYSTHQEAQAAYRSTDAVLNNRFIKLFWHNKENAQENKNGIAESQKDVAPQEVAENKTTKAAPTGNVFTKINNQKPPTTTPNANEKISQSAPTGNAVRTVFNSNAMKKNNVKPLAAASASKVVKKLAAISKILNDQLNQQKKLITLYKKATTDAEKEKIKVLMNTISSSIAQLSEETKQHKDLLAKISPKTPEAKNKSKTEAEKELLDAEMDLYNKQHTGDDTSDLLKRVKYLRDQAKLLGIIPSNNAPWSRRGSLSFRGRGRGRGAIVNVPRSITNLDRRPKKLVIKGPVKDEPIFKHLKQCFDVETTEISDQEVVLTFKTAKEAQRAKTLITPQLSTKSISVAFHNDALNNVKDVAKEPSTTPDDEATSQLEETKESLLLADDDEEEDEESRSWRRWFT